MQIIILAVTALLLIPAAMAGIIRGAHELISAWGEVGSQLDELAQLAEPLLPIGQSLLSLTISLVLLALVGVMLAHALKSRL
jgi:hypothetical protein